MEFHDSGIWSIQAGEIRLLLCGGLFGDFEMNVRVKGKKINHFMGWFQTQAI